MLRVEVLSVYKRLIRYGQRLVFTDKEFFCRRVRQEFLRNIDAEGEKQRKLVKASIFLAEFVVLNCFISLS